MAGNSELIDSIIDPKAVKQVTDLTKELEVLEAQFVETTKVAIALNNATAKTTSFQKLEQDANKTAIALQKLQQEQNKTATTQANLNKANSAAEAQLNRTAQAQAKAQQQQEKATEAAKKALSPYQQLSKQLEKLRSDAKDVGVQFGVNSEQFRAASKPVQDLDKKLKDIDQTLGQSQRNVGNYGNAFGGVLRQYIPFGDSTLKISENLKTLTGDIGESEEGLGGLTAGFAEFSTGAFVVAIAAATYYLSQFKSTGEEVSTITAGLKNGFAQLGANIFGFGGKGDNEITPLEAFQTGKKTKQAENELENKQAVKEIQNESLEAQSNYFRALSDDRTKDISDRVKYLNQAQAIEKKILENQKKTADETIETALKVGFQLSKAPQSVQEKQKQTLRKAALSGNLQPAQDLALDGQQFTSDGLALYQAGLKQIVQYQANSQNEIVRLNADKNNKELRADLELSKAREALSKAQIQGEIDAANLILGNERSTNSQKLAANRNFVNNSIALLKLQEQSQLEAAGIGSTRGGKDTRVEAINRATITQTTENDINAILAKGRAKRQEILKGEQEDRLKITEQDIQTQKDVSKSVIDSESSTLDQRLEAIQKYYDASGNLITVKQKEQIGLANGNKLKEQQAVNEANNAILALTNENEQQINDAYKKAYDQQLQGAKKHDADLLEELRQYHNARIKSINDDADKQITGLNSQLQSGKISPEVYDANVKAAQQSATLKGLQEQVQYEQQLIDLKKKANPEADVSQDEGNQEKARSDQSKLVEQIITENLKNEAKQRADIRQQEYDLAIQLTKGVQTFVDDTYQNQIKRLENQSEALTKQTDVEKQQIDGSIASAKVKADEDRVLDAKALASKQALSDKQKQIQHDEAVFNKAVSAINIAISTEEAIAKIVLSSEVAVAAASSYLSIPVVGYGLYAAAIATISANEAVSLGLAIATGAIQEASILAAPIPAYEKGTKHAKGGPARVSEKGIEAVRTPRGDLFLTPENESIIDIPKGSEVIPNNQLIKMIATPQKLNFVGGQATDMSTVEKLLKENIKVTKANKPGKIYFKTPGSADWQAFERSKRR